MVNDATGHFFCCFPLSDLGTCRPYQARRAHNILPAETRSSRGSVWCGKLMEDVTNHKIDDKGVYSPVTKPSTLSVFATVMPPARHGRPTAKAASV